MTHAQRLANVRDDMRLQQLDAFIVPHDDEHLGEYIPPYAERLAWLTGFTGSAGAAVVLTGKAAVFVDGRYTVQVRHQCDAGLFEYRHLIQEPVLDYVLSELAAGSRVGFDPRLHSRGWFDAANKKLAARDLKLVPVGVNPIDKHWHDRPEPDIQPALLLSQDYSGQHSEAKRNRIAERLAANNIDAQLLTQAEPINWLLNIRGRDIPCLPAVLSFALLHNDGAVQLFAEPAKFNGLDLAGHSGHNVTLAPICELESALCALGQQGARVQLDPATANAWSSLVLEQAGAELVFADDPCMLPKACKNPVEVQGSRAAHLRDGAAVCRFLAWLDRRLAEPHPEREDEGTLADRLQALRAQAPEFVEASFSTISALGPNAAMCHYHHGNGTPRTLGQDAIYLVDSGGQYLDGTTDITRTVAVGEPNDEMRKLFTLVLRGHIDLACARFPAGTGGLQLDALARMPLWQQGYNFDHGTGHGVGHYLSVHEGPQRISPKGSTVPLTTGMIVSNEPGYYRENAFGIRCENLEVVQPAETDGDIPVFEFEHLTQVPFDRRLIDTAWLEARHIDWLNDYHAGVWEKISPQLTGGDLTWLERATRPL
ncbi:aminopeptidase P family protein [Oceanimonas doudoroffii]|uniref:X-Pro aminopeptidase n=1 Tax=Oceanimonas doudoroffii TaxID=84158 RepID=G5CZH3_9GAMM|nr:aminopeptidase P family protein [Oceanimonas doudoroffii]AEQ39129.1 Xaa-Pro aminopeptidase [Oceanimonas doudoroffii]OXY81608.1 X-Pro aminopeptidase [Oceanimonas doudoroffii]